MNSDFYYACLLPFGGQLLMVPFVAIFGVSMTAQLCGMVLFAICFGLALAFLLRSMNFSYKWSVFGVSALFLIVSISEKLREIFWCHIIYYSLGLLFVMVGLGLVLRVLNCENQKEIYDITFNLDSTMLNERYTSPYYIWLTGIGSINGKYIF